MAASSGSNGRLTPIIATIIGALLTYAITLTVQGQRYERIANQVERWQRPDAHLLGAVPRTELLLRMESLREQYQAEYRALRDRVVQLEGLHRRSNARLDRTVRPAFVPPDQADP